MNHTKKKKLDSKFLNLNKTANFLCGTLAVALTLAGTALADQSELVPAIVDPARIYKVIRNQERRPEHKDANIIILQTRQEPDGYGLVFQQTGQAGQGGKGMTCAETIQLKRRGRTDGDLALTCHQHKGLVEEWLTVASLESDFCSKLRERINLPQNNKYHLTPEQHTLDDKNPIATPEECREILKSDNAECVCFEIKHFDHRPEFQDIGSMPPSSGTGTGGHD